MRNVDAELAEIDAIVASEHVAGYLPWLGSRRPLLLT
jgi:hypothetical protein